MPAPFHLPRLCLFALCLLPGLAASAQAPLMPPPTPTAPVVLHWQKLKVNHAVASELAKQIEQKMPEGVARIVALYQDNSLIVEATPAGFEKLKQIVQTLDVERQVQIKIEFVAAPVSEVKHLGVNFDLFTWGQYGSSNLAPISLQYATGKIVPQIFQTLMKTRSKIADAPLNTLTSDAATTVHLSRDVNYAADMPPLPSNHEPIHIDSDLIITPHVNRNNSVTLGIAAPFSLTLSGMAGTTWFTPMFGSELQQTISRGDSIVLAGFARIHQLGQTGLIHVNTVILGGLLPTSIKKDDDNELLVFLTPTIGPDTAKGSAITP